VFGLHVSSGLPVGRIGYRPGAAAASADELRIKVTGRQGHAGYPWARGRSGHTAAQIVLGVQTIVSRRTDLINHRRWSASRPINGGSRFNIVPDVVENDGTIRTYDADVRKGVHATSSRSRNIRQAPTRSDVEVIELYDPLVNNAKDGGADAPVLARAADGNAQPVIRPAPRRTSRSSSTSAGMFFNVGVVPADQDPARRRRTIREFLPRRESLVVGVRALPR